MALAKLCACACSGALLGGGAAQVAQPSKPAGYAVAKSHIGAPHRAQRKRIAINKPKKHQSAVSGSVSANPSGGDPNCDNGAPGGKG